MTKTAFLTIQIQVPLRGKETPKSVSKWVQKRIREAGLVADIIDTSWYQKEFIEDLTKLKAKPDA